jgi:predicted DsbA family dithiol-disulfide isomerase
MPESDPSVQPRLDIVSDAICPWCYIGKRQMERALGLLAARGMQMQVVWHPFQLNPDMPAEGVERSAYRIAKFGSAERARELDARITQAGAAVGLEFHTELMRRTPNTVQAHRLIWRAGQLGVQDAVVEALFAGYFCAGTDIGDAAELAAIGEAAGIADAAAFLAGDEERELVLREDAMARGAGINGVPSFIMEGHVLFSGAVAAEAMADTFTRAWEILSRRAA